MTDAERDAVADAPGDSSIVTWEPGGLARLVFDLTGIAVGLLFAFLALELGLEKGERMGAGFFPFLAALLLAGCLSIDVVRELVHWRRTGRQLGAGRVPLSIALMLLALGGYAVAVEFLGHLVSSALLVAALLVIVGTRRWWQIALAAVITALVTDLVFSALLGLRLPTGFLELGWTEWI
jgi:putative tricarboxylic transport membrane protein